MSDTENRRLAVIAALARKAPRLGRTALMKFCYFLQVLRKLPLGYHFTLYSYGPFDADVLADLDSCEALGGVRSALVEYPGGYGYEIRPGDNVERVQALAGQFIRRHTTDIDWVVGEFGSLSAGVLELVSTIVYADREAADEPKHMKPAQLARRVRDIKPHFDEQAILRRVEHLRSKDLLRSLRTG